MLSQDPHRKAPKEADQPTKDAISVGDTVAYSRAFLQSISAFTGDLPRAKGKVTALVPLGGEITLAEVEWDTPDLPEKVNVKNLCRVGSAAYSD